MDLNVNSFKFKSNLKLKYLRKMLRVFGIRKLFSQFYHPHKFNIDPTVLEPKVCRLHSYITTYREYGHHYARLDPL